jgi:methyltransferase (TIGR00027 family)
MRSISEGVGQTSLLIAAWRAQEAEEIDPLFVDAIANIFVNAETRALSDKMMRASASTRYLINYRTKYFDERLSKVLSQGVAQVVILGSGLDSRAIRLGDNRVRFFEVDQPEVLAFKQQQLTQYGYDCNSRMIGGNYIQDDVIALLVNHGFDPGQETYFIWEGNTMYIPLPDIISLLQKLRWHVANFKISFDYLSPEMIRKTTGFKPASDLVNGFENMAAPWVTGIDDIQPIAGEAGLVVIENLWMIDVVAASSWRVSLDRSLFRNYSVCTLASDERHG